MQCGGPCSRQKRADNTPSFSSQLAALGCAFGDPVVVSIYHEDSEWHFLCLAASQAGDARPAVLDVTVQLPPLAASPDHVRQRLEAGLPCRATARKLPGRPLVCESLVVSSRAPGAAEALLQNRVVLSQCVVHLGHTQAHVLRARAASGATPDAPLRVLPRCVLPGQWPFTPTAGQLTYDSHPAAPSSAAETMTAMRLRRRCL